MRASNRLLPSKWFSIVLGLCAACLVSTQLEAQVTPADGNGAGGGSIAQASYTTSGSYFNRELGTPLRFSYHSEGYGTETGVVSLGTMKVFNLDGAAWFLDGQGTMSEDWGGGFNAGIGYRELVNMSHGFDPERILGASFWTDGQNSKADNFFTQLGFGLESLGESYDVRLNGYFPLERTKIGPAELIDFDTVTFAGNRLFAGLERFTTDVAHSVMDAEVAKRIDNLDAWAIAGVYHVGGGGADDTGYRLGVRGYAVPDLAITLQVTDDDIYHTNVMVGLTWFVGRTHTGNANVGTIVDRFREPVWRNDFIATTSFQTVQGAGGPLTDADNNELFNFIHVNSNADPGGDGTFENPFNNLVEAEAAQAEGAYVYVHGGSVLDGTETFTLLDNVKFWGEGTNEFGDVILHLVDSVERGTLTLPETSPGARDLQSPTINIGAGVTDFLVLADNNNVNNFEFNGGENVIVGDGINAPQLANLDINNPSGTAINFTDITGTAVVDNTVTITQANRGMLIHGGNSGMNINARITNSDGSSLVIEDRTGGTIAFGGSILDTDGTVDINDDGVVDADDADVDTADAIVITGSTGNTIVNFTQTLDLDENLGINVDAGGFRSLFIDNNRQTTTITFADLRATSSGTAHTIEMQDGGTLTINDSDNDSLIANTGTGDAFNNVGNAAANFDSTITINADIENSGGGNAVDISARDAGNVTFGGEITDTDSDGILLTGNSGGTISFNDQVTTTTTGTGNGVTITGGSDATYNFTDVDITTTSGTGFLMTHGGILTVNPSANETNSISTTTGQALVLDGTAAAAGDQLAIGAGGVEFSTINVTGATADAIVLREVEGTGQVVLGSGDDPGDGGTVTTVGTASGIVIDNANNVVVNNIEFNKSGTGQAVSIINQTNNSTVLFSGVDVNATGAANGVVVGSTSVPADGNEDGATVTFTELVVDAENGNAVTVQNNTGGTYIFNDLDASTSGTGNAVHIAANSADTIVTFNGMDLDATGAGGGFVATGGSELRVTGETSVDTTTGVGVSITGMNIGATGAQFDTVNVTDGATNGVALTNLTGTGTVTIGSGSNAGDGGTITSAGTAILVDNADNVAITRMTVANGATAGNGLVIQNQDGGTVNVNGLTSTTSTGAGIVAQNNTGGVAVYTSSNIDVTGSGDGVRLTNNTGATNTFNGLDVDATSGTGFLASGGGTVAATGTNTVSTTTGVGVNMNGVEIGAGGFNLASVDVTNGTTNGVVLTNLTGGQYRQGTGTGTNGAGGTLNTAGNTIVLSGVSDAIFNDVTANATDAGARGALVTHTVTTQATIIFDNFTSTGVAGGGPGIEVIDNGTGELDFTLRNESEIDMTLANTAALLFTAGNSAGVVDLRVTDNILTTDNNAAFLANVNAGTGGVQFLITGNEMSNNSATLGAMQLNVGAARTVNATVGGQGLDPANGNTFANNNATGIAFIAVTTGGSSRINLDLQNNTANSGNTVDYQLGITNGVFGVVDRDATFNDTRNTGNVAPAPGNVEADFLDLNGPLIQVD